MKPVGVGMIGAGGISGQYLAMARNMPAIRVVACADVNLDAARARAAEFGVPKACTVDALLADDDVEIVLNLTTPAAHVPVSLRALEAGKNVFTEKPLGVTVAEARTLLDHAGRAGLRVGSAPDTFLGSGLQTARKAIDDGLIGTPVAFTAFMIGRGHEHWHQNPAFYYQPGGGPMLDMGPYYVTALLNLLGPAKRVMGMASRSRPRRTVGSGPRAGETFDVTTNDHVLGTIEFENGAVGAVIQSFAMRAESGAASPIVVYGTHGTLHVPDPNVFDGEVSVARFARTGDDAFEPVPNAFVTGYGRSVGLADLATALRTGRPHRCGAGQALAALEIMEAFTVSSDTGRQVTPAVPYSRPAPMPVGLPFGDLNG